MEEWKTGKVERTAKAGDGLCGGDKEALDPVGSNDAASDPVRKIASGLNPAGTRGKERDLRERKQR